MDDLKQACDDLQPTIQDEKAHILRMETQKPKDQEMLEEYRLEVIEIAKEKLVSETQIQEVNRYVTVSREVNMIDDI